MKLIERTNTDNLQTYLVSDMESSQAIELIKGNLFQRLLRFISASGITSLEFSNFLALKLKLRILKIKNTENPELPILYIGNINIPSNKIEEVNPLPEKTVEAFKSTGIEFPREKFLSERLKELNFSGEDPFRLKSINSDLVLEESLEGLNYEDLQFSESSFYDKLYSLSSVTLGDKLRATYILSLDKIIMDSNASERDFTKETLTELVKDIDDKQTQKLVLEDLSNYLNNPNNRPKLIDNAKRTLKSKTSNDSTTSIKTWKVVTACVIVILGVLAYTKRDSLRTAFQISKEANDLETNKFSLFTKSLFSREGTSRAKDYLNGKTQRREAKTFLRKKESLISRAKADIKEGKFKMSESKRWFNGRH